MLFRRLTLLFYKKTHSRATRIAASPSPLFTPRFEKKTQCLGFSVFIKNYSCDIEYADKDTCIECIRKKRKARLSIYARFIYMKDENTLAGKQ